MLSHKVHSAGVVAFAVGIGQGRVTANLQDTHLDDAVFVSDEESVEMVRCYTAVTQSVIGIRLLFMFQTFRLLHEEGFCVGASSGLNVAAAVQVQYHSR